MTSTFQVRIDSFLTYQIVIVLVTFFHKVEEKVMYPDFEVMPWFVTAIVIHNIMLIRHKQDNKHTT